MAGFGRLAPPAGEGQGGDGEGEGRQRPERRGHGWTWAATGSRVYFSFTPGGWELK
jgi:hypothetical protein